MLLSIITLGDRGMTRGRKPATDTSKFTSPPGIKLETRSATNWRIENPKKQKQKRKQKAGAKQKLLAPRDGESWVNIVKKDKEKEEEQDQMRYTVPKFSCPVAEQYPFPDYTMLSSMLYSPIATIHFSRAEYYIATVVGSILANIKFYRHMTGENFDDQTSLLAEDIIYPYVLNGIGIDIYKLNDIIRYRQDRQNIY